MVPPWLTRVLLGHARPDDIAALQRTMPAKTPARLCLGPYVRSLPEVLALLKRADTRFSVSLVREDG